MPQSVVNITHYAWYKSKIKTGNIVIPGFNSNSINQNDVDDSEIEVDEKKSRIDSTFG